MGRLRVGRPLSRRSDAALIRATQRGDREAVDELFRRHWPAAHRAAWLVVHDSAAAEDIAQEAFLSALRALDRFDRRRPLGPWLHRIVVNRAIDWARARALRPEADAGTLPEAAATPREPASATSWSPRSPASAPSIARWSSCATCSGTRPARSRRCSTCRAAPSIRACAARWTPWPPTSRPSDERPRTGAARGADPRRSPGHASACGRPCSPPIATSRRARARAPRSSGSRSPPSLPRSS